MEKRYNIRIEYTFPDAQETMDLVREKGMFSFYEDGHQECCRVRKVGLYLLPHDTIISPAGILGGGVLRKQWSRSRLLGDAFELGTGSEVMMTLQHRSCQEGGADILPDRIWNLCKWVVV